MPHLWPIQPPDERCGLDGHERVRPNNPRRQPL